MSEDIFQPQSSPEDALVEQLHTVTYLTAEKQKVEQAFREGYKLDWSGWQKPEMSELGQLNSYFGLSGADWEMASFFATGAGSNVQIRVIYNPAPAARVREEYDGFFTGGATISFPKPDLYEHETLMNSIGIKSTIGVKEMEFQSPNGEVYISAEIVYFAPENVYLMAVKRPDIFVPVGPVDEETDIGGAAYSARCVENADDVIGFLKDIMGLEIRRDVEFEIGERSALLMPQGAKERFIQAFAPGASSGYCVIMDHGPNNRPSTAPTFGPPSRGIVMWSFRTKDMDEVVRRAEQNGAKILKEAAEMNSPFLGGKRTVILEDPSGFPIEIFEG